MPSLLEGLFKEKRGIGKETNHRWPVIKKYHYRLLIRPVRYVLIVYFNPITL
jgi:hypothetical protein